MDKGDFSPTKKVRSFGNALRGVWVFLRSAHNAWLMVLSAIVVVALGLYFRISEPEWLAVIISCGSVLASEAFNSAIEVDIDLTSPEYHPYARDTKDIAAGAVLISVTTAAIVGLIVFGPKIYTMLH